MSVSDPLMLELYANLRELAHARLRKSRGTPLQTTDLIHDTYVRLRKNESNWESKAHFFGAASMAMRNIIVDLARRAQREERALLAISMSDSGDAVGAADVLALDSALDELAQINPKSVELVILRFFGGLTVAQAAEISGIPERTASRLWAHARAFLRERLGGE